MNKSEFSDLVRDLARRMYGYAFRFLRRQEEAEDAVQEVFLKLWKMKDKLDSYSSVEALATTMIRNYCIDRLRRDKHVSYETNITDYVLVADITTPCEAMEEKESDSILRSIIESLPDNYRSIIVQKEIEGLSYDEIAQKTGMNVNNLRVIVARARRMIRDEYNRFHYERRSIEKAAGEVL